MHILIFFFLLVPNVYAQHALVAWHIVCVRDHDGLGHETSYCIASKNQGPCQLLVNNCCTRVSIPAENHASVCQFIAKTNEIISKYLDVASSAHKYAESDFEKNNRGELNACLRALY